MVGEGLAGYRAPERESSIWSAGESDRERERIWGV
jgi:hypothetical protein